MSSMQGQFVWCELMTTDVADAAAFYGAVIGWTTHDAGPEHGGYNILNAGDIMVGGLMPMPQPVRDAGGRPSWMGYVNTDDVDAMAARVTAAGGSVHRPASDIPDTGRFAVVADPQGAAFTLFQPNPGAPATLPPDRTPGRVGWHELHAAAWEPAFAFYAGLFGWTKTDAVDMGPMGTYQTFATAPGGAMAGGMMTKTDAVPAPLWLYYFNVADINAAAARVKAEAGQVVHGPMPVPGGQWIAQCIDRQGVLFALVAPGP